MSNLILSSDKEWAEILCWIESNQTAEVDKIRLDIIVVGKASNVWYVRDGSSNRPANRCEAAESEEQADLESFAEDWIVVENKPTPTTYREQSSICRRRRGLR